MEPAAKARLIESLTGALESVGILTPCEVCSKENAPLIHQTLMLISPVFEITIFIQALNLLKMFLSSFCFASFPYLLITNLWCQELLDKYFDAQNCEIALR